MKFTLLEDQLKGLPKEEADRIRDQKCRRPDESVPAFFRRVAEEYVETLSKEEAEYYRPDLEALVDLQEEVENKPPLTPDQIHDLEEIGARSGDRGNIALLEELRQIRIQRSKMALDDPDNRVGPFARNITKPRVENPYRSKWFDLKVAEDAIIKKLIENEQREVEEAVKESGEADGEEG